MQGQVPACMQQQQSIAQAASPAAPSPAATAPTATTPPAQPHAPRSPKLPGSGSGLQVTPPARAPSEAAPSPREPSPLAQMSVHQLLQLMDLDAAFDDFALPEDLAFIATSWETQVCC